MGLWAIKTRADSISWWIGTGFNTDSKKRLKSGKDIGVNIESRNWLNYQVEVQDHIHAQVQFQ